MVFADIMKEMGERMGMIPRSDNPFGCGSYSEGDGTKTLGFYWYLVFGNYFVITKCDYTFTKDTKFIMPEGSLYMTIRLDYARHLPPGKILAFMEETGTSAYTVVPAGTRVAYTEVTYIPEFYKKHLKTEFSGAKRNPLKLLKDMGGDHNWSSGMMRVLMNMHECGLSGLAAELFYVGKAYELFAELVAMGRNRIPKKQTDYDDISAIISYLDEHYTSRITQAELVELSHMSPTKLKTLFRQFTDCTITDYVMKRRADRAGHLLSDTDLSVAEIARSVGFDTSTGFATSFKKVTGISPSEYRKQMAFHCLFNPSAIENLKI